VGHGSVACRNAAMPWVLALRHQLNGAHSLHALHQGQAGLLRVEHDAERVVCEDETTDSRSAAEQRVLAVDWKAQGSR